MEKSFLATGIGKTFAVVLSVYQKAVNSSSDGSGSSGTAFAYGSTVTISSLPNVVVSSAPLPTISHYLMCGNVGYPSDNSGTWYYYTCDATDSTELIKNNYFQWKSGLCNIVS